jgi:hypothetical protein
MQRHHTEGFILSIVVVVVVVAVREKQTTSSLPLRESIDTPSVRVLEDKRVKSLCEANIKKERMKKGKSPIKVILMELN